MAEDTSNNLVYWLQLKLVHKEYLGAIRHWDNLKMATDKDHLWVKDFTAVQLDSAALKSIPFTALFYCKDDQLFLKGSLLIKYLLFCGRRLTRHCRLRQKGSIIIFLE
jgi:hypothetical protein